MARARPISPDWMIFHIVRTGGVKLRVCPARNFTPVRFAVSTIFCASSRLSAIGFSTTTCLPASIARIECSAWKRFGVETHTASTSGSASISS